MKKMKKIIILIIISLSIINVSGQSYTTCSTTPGELSGTSTDITVNQSTLAPVYTTVPSPAGTIPQNEFLIVLDNNLAYDNLGDAIISSNSTAIVTPSSLSLTTGDTFSIVSFSYDIQQFKLLTDGLLTNAIPFLGSCCSIVDNQSGISGFCTALSAVGITSGADVNTLEDVINIISIYNYGSVKSLSLAGLNNILNKLNTDITTYDGIGCTNAVVGICYAFDTLSTKHDIYNVVVSTPYVNIPDANFKTYLVGNTLINTNGDTEIQVSEATAFSGYINVSYLGISDVTGIEAFTNLTELYCNNNSLTSLDLSANTALTQISCKDNSLTSLNVSGAIALTHFYCNNNNLSSLDVSTNTVLLELDCNNNSLTSLDVSTNTDLIDLICSTNNLTTLNVANGNNSNSSYFNAVTNPNLTCIQVDDVAYSTANWTNVDATASFSTDCTATLIIDENILLDSFKLYPNPVRNILNIQLEGKFNKLEIYSILGKKMLESTLLNTNVSNLSSGMYLLKVYTKKGKVDTKRFIKK